MVCEFFRVGGGGIGRERLGIVGEDVECYLVREEIGMVKRGFGRKWEVVFD